MGSPCLLDISGTISKRHSLGGWVGIEGEASGNGKVSADVVGGACG